MLEPNPSSERERFERACSSPKRLQTQPALPACCLPPPPPSLLPPLAGNPVLTQDALLFRACRPPSRLPSPACPRSPSRFPSRSLPGSPLGARTAPSVYHTPRSPPTPRPTFTGSLFACLEGFLYRGESGRFRFQAGKWGGGEGHAGSGSGVEGPTPDGPLLWTPKRSWRPLVMVLGHQNGSALETLVLEPGRELHGGNSLDSNSLPETVAKGSTCQSSPKEPLGFFREGLHVYSLVASRQQGSESGDGREKQLRLFTPEFFLKKIKKNSFKAFCLKNGRLEKSSQSHYEKN